MDRARRPHRPPLPPVRLRRRARRRAGHRADGLGRRGRRGDGRGPDAPRGEKVGRAQGAAVPPVPGRGTSSRALPPTRADASPCSTAPRSPAPSASRSTRTWSPPCTSDGRRRRRRRCRGSIGGRYGLSSKEFTPAMVKAVFDELAATGRATTSPSASSTTSRTPAWTTTPTSRPSGPTTRAGGVLRARRDGTVGANKNSIKIIGEETDLYAQGYFVYDSKKSGSVTVSHLRFGPEPIRSTYLIAGGRLRRLPPVRLPRAHRRARPWPSPARPSCSTAPTAPTRSGTTCRARCRSRSSTSSCASA